MKNQLSTVVIFKGSSLITTKIKGIEYVAMRPVIEGIGLDWASQSTKLKRAAHKFNCCDIATVAQDGKLRQMLCIPLKKLNGWLFSINPQKVKESVRDKLIAYQEECFVALHDYWSKGVATRKQLTPAEVEAQEIARYDKETFENASKGAVFMNVRKRAKKEIK
ncbi:phage antirepressor N-terminal domain-containing protein [Thorsellia kenyensis]|uniref:Phage antirepressor N-terminal domain-containing protein n=1 Tax=Thorsellia kenyensis TaxID=1549888 RepID=A0ABV6CBT4_9GAMM